jgi:hypothetical protein
MPEWRPNSLCRFVKTGITGSETLRISAGPDKRHVCLRQRRRPGASSKDMKFCGKEPAISKQSAGIRRETPGNLAQQNPRLLFSLHHIYFIFQGVLW